MSILFCNFVVGYEGRRKALKLSPLKFHVEQKSNLNPKSRKGTETMTKDEKMTLAKKLINEEINKTLSRWNGHDLTTYAWGWRDEWTVSSNHDSQFFYLEEVRAITKALGLSYTLAVGPNCDGQPTPYISIF